LIIDVPQALMICMDVSSGLVISLIAFDIHIFYIRELLFMQTSSGNWERTLQCRLEQY